MLHEKLTKYFPLRFNTEDSLPKVACTGCASVIHQTEEFVLRAQEVELDLLERMRRSQALENVMSPAAIRCLASSMAAKSGAPKPPARQNIKDVLKKLSASSLTVKKINSKPPDQETDSEVASLAPFLKMKMEVLDEELENIPTEDFVQYNDTDDEEAQREAARSFHNIESIDIKESFSAEESDEGPAYDASSGEDYVPPKMSQPKQVKKVRRRLPKPKPKTQVSPKSVVINLKDPCQFVCVTCKGKFTSFEQLQGHLDESVACKKTNSTCNICKKICPNRRALAQHKLTHGARPQFVCDQCGKVYTNSFNLENHKSQVHGEETDFGYVYKCCEQTFKTRRELSEHTATHTKLLNLLCDVCGKNFTSQKALKSHSISHTNIRPFPCEVCDKAFRTRLLLIQHTHVHTGIKAFNCDICEKAFAKKESLRKHYKQHSSEPVSWSSTGEKLSVRPIEQLQHPLLPPSAQLPAADHDGGVQEQILPDNVKPIVY